MVDPRDEQTALRRRGRLAGIAVFSLVLTAFTVICSVQVLQQVWAPRSVPSQKTCRLALQGLVQAVDRARLEASRETRGERASVRRFRSSLEPEWASRAALSQQCRQDSVVAQGLKVVDWLRYAEEHAVRYEAVDLAHLRRRTAELMEEIRANPD